MSELSIAIVPSTTSAPIVCASMDARRTTSVTSPVPAMPRRPRTARSVSSASPWSTITPSATFGHADRRPHQRAAALEEHTVVPYRPFAFSSSTRSSSRRIQPSVRTP
jgi:hypothetical protein